MSLDLTQADERFPEMGKLNIRLEFRNGSELIYQQRLLEGPAQCGLRKNCTLFSSQLVPYAVFLGQKYRQRNLVCRMFSCVQTSKNWEEGPNSIYPAEKCSHSKNYRRHRIFRHWHISGTNYVSVPGIFLLRLLFHRCIHEI